LIPERQIRAYCSDAAIRVYQAYSHAIADSALAAQTFVSLPFSMTRMTWIKPSFLWMMYRAGWGKKISAKRASSRSTSRMQDSRGALSMAARAILTPA
jgi:hypothetical protein